MTGAARGKALRATPFAPCHAASITIIRRSTNQAANTLIHSRPSQRRLPPWLTIQSARWLSFTFGADIQIYESRFRPVGHHVQRWLDYQQDKVLRALAFAEQHYTTMSNGAPHIGEIALACALGFLDFRFDGRWRAGHPRLVAWHADFASRVPAYAATAPS